MIVLLMFAQLILEDASRVWTYLSTGSYETDMHLGFAGALSDNVVDCQMPSSQMHTPNSVVKELATS